MRAATVLIAAAFPVLVTLYPCLPALAEPQSRPADEFPSGEPTVTVVPEAGQILPCDLARGKPVVRAMINGRGPFPFLLDTGAGAVVINKDLADELKLPRKGKTRIGDPSNPQAIEADQVHLESITLGESTFSDLTAVSWDRGSLYSGADAPRGVLGFPLFRGCLLTLDYPRNQVRLEVGALPPADGREVIGFHVVEGGVPGVEVELAGRRMQATIDTGSMGGIGVNDSIAGSMKWSEQPVVVGRGRTVNSEFEVKRGRMDGSFKLAGATVESPQVTINPVIQQVNLGTAFLRDFAVTFDQQRHRVRFQRPATGGDGKSAAATAGAPEPGWTATGGAPREPAPPPGGPQSGRPRLGIGLARAGGPDGVVLTLRQVLADSPAERAGLKAGDEILMLNGMKVADLPEPKVHEILTSGDPVRFDVRRGEQKLSIEVRPREER